MLRSSLQHAASKVYSVSKGGFMKDELARTIQSLLSKLPAIEESL